jgi:hypothetical protein
MVSKRKGAGGNTSRDPKGNLIAQAKYIEKLGKQTKKCTGFQHHDLPEIPIANFRQQNGNSGSGLQSRCDQCNRLYFSIGQKPIKRLAAIAIWANETKEFDWRMHAPKTLHSGIENVLNYWSNTKCKSVDCNYKFKHSDYREAANVLTNSWKNLDKGPRTSTVTDDKTGQVLAAPQFMHDLQKFASSTGTLAELVDTKKVWSWWQTKFDQDTATCSAELNAIAAGELDPPAPEHSLIDFSWGSGNIKTTIQGHTVPAFNQVNASASFLPKGSQIGGRAYGFLCEGDHLSMLKFSKECKKKGLSLGHSPAPLRWLGKNDPSNGQAQPLDENVQLRDSLIDLHKALTADPESAQKYLSWQIADFAKELGEKKISFEEFTTRIQDKVETYFDELHIAALAGNLERIRIDVIRADPGKTQDIYEYRVEKVQKWLGSRPTAKSLK